MYSLVSAVDYSAVTRSIPKTTKCLYFLPNVVEKYNHKFLNNVFIRLLS